MIPSHLTFKINHPIRIDCQIFTDTIKFINSLQKVDDLGAKKRLTALDMSPRRIGVAISDQLREFSIPLGTLHYDSNSISNSKKILDTAHNKRILRLIRAIDSDWIIGWPLDKMGKTTQSTDNVLQMINLFNNTVSLKKANILLYDERYTTEMARADILDNRTLGKPVTNDLDSMAAARILREFLDVLSRHT